MKLRYTVRAVSDLERIADYLLIHSPTVAARVGAAIEKALANLTVFPNLGRRQAVEGVRKVSTRRYPYLIYYRLDPDADEIIILAVQHDAQDREFIEA